MEEEIRVDPDAFEAVIKDSAENGGLVIKAYVPEVAEENMNAGSSVIPIVEAEGCANPVTLAYAIMSLEATIKEWKKYEEVADVLEFLQDNTSCRAARIEQTKENEND